MNNYTLNNNNLNNNNITTSPLKIAFWNACGLRNKMTEVELYMRRESVQIMMIIETRTPANSSVLNVSGYQTYTASHPETHRKGGVAIFVRSDIRHTALQPLNEEFLQCAPIALLPANNNNKKEIIIIAPIYCPPVYIWTHEHFSKLFKHFENLTHAVKSKFILCGDWNARHMWWGNPRGCQRGKSLYASVQSHRRLNILATGGATHFPYNRRNNPSAIDFAVFSGIDSSRLQIHSCTDLDSDHLPLRIDLLANKNQDFGNQNTNPRLLSKNADTKRFQEILEQKIHLDTEIRSGMDIEDAVDIFLRNINEAAIAASQKSRRPQSNQLRSRYRHNHDLELDEPTRSLLRDKQHRKQILLATRTPEARRLYNAAQNKLKKALIKLKNKNINKIFEGIDTQDRYSMQKLWRLTNKLKQQVQPNYSIKIPITGNTGVDAGNGRGANSRVAWTKTTAEKAEAFATHLEDRFSPKFSNTEGERDEIRNSLRQNILHKQQQLAVDQQYDCSPITLNELKIEIQALELAKSPGEDKIDNRLIKCLPQKALEYLVIIYNSIIKYGHFPKQWKHAGITLILKPGKKSTSEMTSYRPISLLSGLSKIFEKLIMSRLFNIQDFAKAVPNHQFGFRREHGTEQQLARVTQFILQAYEERKFCSAVFVDIAEAFDRVWHDGLLYKLIQILPLQLFNILQSYLSERTFTVSLSDGTKSKTGRVSAGVPQGSVLGPILYTIYSSDMPMPILTQRRVNLQPNQNRMLLSTYADDTVIMCASDVPASAVRENQSYLVHFSQWAKKWAININPSKTGHIIFTLRKLNDTDKRRSPLINGELAPCVNAQTYLGVTLDRKLTLEHHVKKLKIRVRARECKLMWLIGKRSRLAKECKALIIKQLIMPIWQYAIPIWGALTCDTHVNRLQSLQNKIIRNSVNASLYIRSSTLRDTYDLKSIDEVFQLASARFANSCSVHANPEARNLIIQPYEPQRLRRPRYLQQLQQHILPLQSLARAQIQGPQNSPVQNDNIQRDDRPEQRQQIIPFLPTLLRLEEEELDRQETERLAEETRRRQLLRSRSPPRRFCEMQINAYRRRYRNGQLTREAAVAIIQGQPAAIQRIIVHRQRYQHQQRIQIPRLLEDSISRLLD